MKTYAAIYNNNEIRENSSSGGIFSALADKFDVVYGVAMTDDCYGAEIIRVEGDISPLRGSKYFQAKVGDAFKQVRKDLMDGKKVLFSGTGCQINGLSTFLGKEFSNLFLLDIICHGAPSPKLWRAYAKYQENKHGKLENVNFRCKDDSWVDFGMKENQLYISKDTDSFMRMFLRNYCFRPACYECHAKHYKKSDMTIADFWGIQNVAPEMNDGKGTSLVITRTEKGQELFDSIKSELKWKEVSYEDGVKGNPSEYSSVARPQQRDTFFTDLEKIPFEEMEKKYAADIKVSLPRKVVRKIKRTIKKILGGGTQKLTPMLTTVSSSRSRSNADYGMLLTFTK
jgi:coenzyme F420-reducing hydrogenase beta subunit